MNPLRDPPSIIYIPLCFYLYSMADRSLGNKYKIYIPLCFYLYAGRVKLKGAYALFTFHYVSTYTTEIPVYQALKDHLHSTMFLLIPNSVSLQVTDNEFTFHYVSTYTTAHGRILSPLSRFTFHYVSTYTICTVTFPFESGRDLHSTMFLLIHVRMKPLLIFFNYLHSTMFLLIHRGGSVMITYTQYLHSTMFLLIRSGIRRKRRRFLNLHSTMFLLIPGKYGCSITFHLHLHSTMFLLIRRSGILCKDRESQFTFHYVSTYTVAHK